MVGNLAWMNFIQVRIHWQRLLKTVNELLGVCYCHLGIGNRIILKRMLKGIWWEVWPGLILLRLESTGSVF